MKSNWGLVRNFIHKLENVGGKMEAKEGKNESGRQIQIPRRFNKRILFFLNSRVTSD